MLSIFNKNKCFDCLSIVLQGPSRFLDKAIATQAAISARKSYPGAEIIVSCWEGDIIDDLVPLVDKVIQSPDPGAQYGKLATLNVNRQIVSSRAGVGLATRPYVLKARSDLLFSSEKLWSEYVRAQRAFTNINGYDPILITNLTTVNPNRQRRFFSLCDWIYLGPRASIVELFKTPMYPDEDVNYLFEGDTVLRYNAEQWITVNFLTKHGLDINVISDGYVTGASIEESHRRIVGKHFVMSSWFRLGLRTQKHRISSFSLDNMYTHCEWAEEFLMQRSFFDFERMAISAAYHPAARIFTKRLRRFFRA